MSVDAEKDDARELEEKLEGIVRTVVARHAGDEPERVARKAGGISSHTFEADVPRDRFIIRMGEGAEKLAGFERERRAVERARHAGVPTQRIVAVGSEDGWAYSMAQSLAGTPAADHPERLRVLEELGRFAAVVHTICTVGFGRDFSWAGDAAHADAQPRLAHDESTGVEPAGVATWSGFLYEELKARERLDLLCTHRVLADRQHALLAATLDEVSRWDAAPVLNHGDLRLKNVVVNDEGHILGLIDWEACVSCIGSQWDTSLALHDLGIDAKEAFLAGYGMSSAVVHESAPVWRLFNAINYAPRVEQLVAEGDEQGLERLRTRLSGALDLYGAA